MTQGDQDLEPKPKPTTGGVSEHCWWSEMVEVEVVVVVVVVAKTIRKLEKKDIISD